MVLKKAHTHLKSSSLSDPSDSESATTGKSVFVIQKHQSKRLHYDLHLEIDGVLKSWAIPKGFSSYPDEEQLAIPTDDHPVEYADFEGVIPKHQYGSGTVMVWDTGIYENMMIKDGSPLPIQTCYKNGQIEVYLRGNKISGRYILIRSERNEIEQNWLLIRKDSDEAGGGHARTEDTSILTGRTMSQIKRDGAKR